MYYVKIMNKNIMCQFSTTAWSGFDCTILRQISREIVTKIQSYRCHAWNIYFDIHNLSQTDMNLSKRRFSPHNFHCNARRNLWSSGSYGYFDSHLFVHKVNLLVSVCMAYDFKSIIL